MRVISPSEMPNDAQIVIRVPQEMADRIRRYAEELSANTGVPVSVAAATRKLLADALDQAAPAKGRRR